MGSKRKNLPAWKEEAKKVAASLNNEMRRMRNEIYQESVREKLLTDIHRGQLEAKRRTLLASSEAGGFYMSKAWRSLRYQALLRSSGKCECCGRTQHNGVTLHVDHIKPRSKYPELELSLSNLQVLCDDCNLGKSNKDDTDWRSTKAKKYKDGDKTVYRRPNTTL